MTRAPSDSELREQTVGLLRSLIRNRCVNDGSRGSGNELASVRTLQAFFGDVLRAADVRSEVVEPSQGRASLIIRIPGRRPTARSLALLGHLDVVPTDEAGWSRDPFAADLVDGEVWGRGAVDMLTLTSAMAVVTRLAADPDLRPDGDLVFAAVADEESGGTWGARWIVEHRPELVTVDDALTEQGGVPLDRSHARPGITLGVGEKGSAPRTIEVTGVPGHGSTPWMSKNAAGIAAQVVRRLLEEPVAPSIQPHWVSLVRALQLPDELEQRLLDAGELDRALPLLGDLAPLGHALTHMTISPNILRAGDKRNVIPGRATIDLDIRVLPGQTSADVDDALATALAPWQGSVRVLGSAFTPGSLSPATSDVFGRIVRVIGERYPGSPLATVIGPGGSDGRYLRSLGTNVYGFGLFSRRLDLSEFRSRLHGNDERIDVESVGLTAAALARVVLGGERGREDMRLAASAGTKKSV